MSWILFTLGAVTMQTFRNALQSQLSDKVATSGVTLARFIFAAPITAIYLIVLYQIWPENTWNSQALLPAQGDVNDQFQGPGIFPDFPPVFIYFVLFASVLQIAATSFMVMLFKQKNFAVGAGLAKSEALVAGVIGTIFFGSQLSMFGWLGILVGAVAVFILSSGASNTKISISTLMLGLLCGTCFALTSLFVREASLVLSVPFPFSAAWVLLCVLCVQTFVLLVYIGFTSPHTLVKLYQNLGATFAISVTSCLGSICWFSAMALQHVAYVKTLGQLEVLFTLVLAHFWLKNTVKPKEVWGLLLIALAAILVMWA